MEHTEIYKRVYEILGRHPLSNTDCGELCGKLCCCYTNPDDTQGGVELLPGEADVFDLEADWHKPGFLSGSLYDYPPEWGGKAGLIQIRCHRPCPRADRPVNCRLFPFQIYHQDGVYYLALTGAGYYECPLLSRKELINPKFIAASREAAHLLLQIPHIKILVDWDSRQISQEEIKMLVPIDTL